MIIYIGWTSNERRQRNRSTERLGWRRKAICSSHGQVIASTGRDRLAQIWSTTQVYFLIYNTSVYVYEVDQNVINIYILMYRYLLQLMTEAGCVEWSFLIAFILRDAMAVLRTTNAAKSSDISMEAVGRLKKAFQDLCSWIDTEWWLFFFYYYC